MPPESNVESTLIWFKAGDQNNIKYWTNEIEAFLKTYEPPTNPTELDNKKMANRVKCDYSKDTDNPPPGKVCEVDIKSFHTCTKENSFNYGKGEPCIFLKLNKIFNWQPELYNDTTKLPDKMPKDLKEAIKQPKLQDKLNTVWISCGGENPADVENIGPIAYYPNRGFPGYYFPFQNQLGYMPPIVAIHFEKPKTGVLINIECKAWARNIIHDRTERRGSVHFELMID
jgi:sodium/potassium-transporting ATPase subunit beta